MYINQYTVLLLSGEQIGYCENKSKLQEKISLYIENGAEQNVAFVQIDELPEYKMCLLKRGITTNDDEIYNKIIKTGTVYYNYFAVTLDGEEKVYVSSFEEAEAIINGLKEKESSNKDALGIIEKYEVDTKDFIGAEEAIASLYVEPVKVVEEVNTETVTKKTNSSSGSIAVAFIQPVSGRISSRYGAISSIRSGAHTGLDIATSTGTTIKAAAAGKVVHSGWKGSYGKLVIIDHGNGVQTYYGHCSSLDVKVGQSVSQGEAIAKVGSTGNSTGPHLHFEIRLNGKAVNPQSYVYK